METNLIEELLFEKADTALQTDIENIFNNEILSKLRARDITLIINSQEIAVDFYELREALGKSLFEINKEKYRRRYIEKMVNQITL